MSLQHIQKNSPRLLPKPAKFEKNPPNGYRVIRKTKCGAGGAGGAAGAGGARSSPIHKQASLAGRLIKITTTMSKVNPRSHHDVAYLHLLTNVYTKCQLPAPYSFRDIRRQDFKVKVTRLKVESRSHHDIAHLHPQPMSLPSINLLHFMDSMI